MRSPTRLLASALVLTAALSCGGDDDDSGPAVEDLPPLIVERLCAEIEDCFDAHSLQQLYGKAGCKGQLLAKAEDKDWAALEDAVDDGRVKYDSGKLDRCLDQIKGLGCDIATSRALNSDYCDQVFRGTVERGGECVVNAECKGVSFCKMTDKCPGKCSALLKAGDDCADNDDCENGLLCTKAKTCAAPAKDGDACGGDVGGECAPGLACIGAKEDPSTAGTCRALADVFTGKLDDDCDFDTGKLCRTGLSCVARSSGGTVSLKCEEPVGSGDACHFGAPSPCPDGEYCDADIRAGVLDGKCRTLPKAGEECLTIAADSPCAAGSICDVDHRCHPVNRLGQPCVSDAGCASERCEDQKCVKKAECDP
jgi:hypothetical protein